MDYNLEREAFLKWSNRRGGDVTNLGFLTTEGRLVVSDNHACHAGLHHTGYWMFVDKDGKEIDKVGKYSFTKDPIAALYSGIVNDDTPVPALIRFADYLINRSPWADCFLNPTGEDVVDNCWVLDAAQPSNYIAGACMATRWPTEWPQRCKAWFALVRAGVDENEAMFLSHGLEGLGQWDDVFPIMVNTGSAWHTPLEKCTTKEYFNNFINNKGRRDKPYFEHMGYKVVSNTWGKVQWDKDFSFFSDIKPRGEEKQIKATVNLNIFFKPKKVNRQVGHKYTSPIQLVNLVEDMKEIINAT